MSVPSNPAVKSDPLSKSGSFSTGGPTTRAVLEMVERLFDHVPETVFFLKNHDGLYAAVNQTLVERCGLSDKRQIIGKHVRQLFPEELALRFAKQDETVIRTGVPLLDRLELHWYERRRAGWCLTTKLPWRDGDGKVIGLAGISRDLRTPGDKETIPESLAATLEHLENNFADTVSPASLAKHAKLSPVRFARLTKRIFRITPHQLIVQTRLNAAARMLSETSHSVAQIAVDCGFYDHSAFTRAFRSATQLTPSQFREMHR